MRPGSKKWLDRKELIRITCPKCGRRFSKMLGELESEHRFTCPAVGCDHMIRPVDFKTGLKAVEKELDKGMADLDIFLDI